ncbi:MAG: outer membrane lipoprotein-sorting protein, partial [Litorivicinus sp.]
EYRAHQVEYYDRKGSLLKTLVASGWEQFEGQYWRPSLMDMTNHQTGKGTQLLYSDWVFNNGMDEKDFTKTALKRLR